MNLDELTQAQQDAILTHFRGAVASRVAQWDHEREIEKILGEEIEIDIGYLAVGFMDGESITWDDFLNAAL